MIEAEKIPILWTIRLSKICVARSGRVNSNDIGEGGEEGVRGYEFVRTRWRDVSVGISERYYSR